MSLSMPAGSRIEPADKIGAGADRLIEELGGTLVGDDAALREGDELDADHVANRLAHVEECLEPGEADLTIDVDVAAQKGRAIADHSPDQPERSLLHRVGKLAANFLLAGDAFGNRIARPMRLERQPEERLVEVDMTVNQARNEKRAGEIDALGASRRAHLADLGDPAALDAQVGVTPVRQQRVSEDSPRHGISFIRRAATTW